jgi:transposase InsO family protein
MQAQGGLTIERMWELGRVSRASFYRHWQQQDPRGEEMEVRAQIQQIVLTHRGNYGYRRVSQEWKDQGLAVNHKRVLRLMQEDNLLAVRRRKLVLTTDARHDLPVYLNLAARMQLRGIDQLWVADITYSTPSQRSPPSWG